MSPENQHSEQTIEFAGQQVEPFMERAADAPLEVRNAVENVLELLAATRTEIRLAEYNAILGYFEQLAEANEGVVRIEDIRTTLIDVLQAKK